jgi:4'-phosphopantetheinyl transferase EntD
MFEAPRVNAPRLARDRLLTLCGGSGSGGCALPAAGGAATFSAMTVRADAPDDLHIQRLRSAPILLGVKPIRDDDLLALTPEEAPAFAKAVAKVRRQSGAARAVARALLRHGGWPATPIPRLPTGAPAWPAGVTGSLAHDDDVAVAAIASRADVAGLGVDVEPDLPLPTELIERVATPSERRRYGPDVLASRRLFVAKEAVFKATHPIDGVFLDFHDVEVDLLAGRAATCRGREVELCFAPAARLIAVAHLPASAVL